ncbi:tetratricopeptide repeat protein [Rhodocaloribacter litoris]|uniref:tetratricopeptide repeat protein n=1 Tax=Rhodocaloribacter litoris TaxID=2558931 RepID=UPI001424A024|nr:tetratricopeptide repeat protein [Rhodocaloribacter litoris]QXD16565.1 tetratricopeptide repeat protein [Rhodocaloribacter litoris]GIV59543.1 MAG: hypothetical protein KatS3mg043_0632 [Rhodothermaceae bacterium]
MKAFTIIFAVLLFLAGCRSGPDSEALTITERKRMTVDPRVGAFLIEGQRAYERGAYALALALTDSAEHYAPDLADLHFLRGLVYSQLNQLELAQAAYQEVLRLDPAYRGARYNIGLNAFRAGKLRDAIDWFKEERKLEPTSGLMLELGRAYARLGEPDSARMAYEAALALDSTNATAHMWLGQLYEEMGELDQALTASRHGLRLKPDNLNYRYIVGSLLHRMGRNEEARAYLQPVAESLRWHQGAQFNYAQVLMRLGRADEARRYFARADSAQQLQQQINEAQDAINREPEVLANWVRLGELLRRAEQYGRAVEAYKVAVSLQPENLYLQSNLALLMAENGDTAGAIRRYRAILGIDSTLADVWFNLGVVYANAGRPAEARQAWEQTLKYKPNHPVVRAYLRQLAEKERG